MNKYQHIFNGQTKQYVFLHIFVDMYIYYIYYIDDKNIKIHRSADDNHNSEPS